MNYLNRLAMEVAKDLWMDDNQEHQPARKEEG